MSELRVPHPIEVLFGDGAAMACGPDGELRADELHGLFAGDTRVLSTLRMTIGGRKWQVLSRRRVGHGTGRWRFQSPEIRDPRGTLAEGCLFLELDRRVAGALHDHPRITSYVQSPIRTTLVVQFDGDFADIFEVRQQRDMQPRLAVERVATRDGFLLTYEHGGFSRRLHVTIGTDAAPQLVGSLLLFDLALEPGGERRLCMSMEPEVDGRVMRFVGDPHRAEESTLPEDRVTVASSTVLAAPFEQGCADLHALALATDGQAPYVAAGAPWFYTLFGRDSLLPALMARDFYALALDGSKQPVTSISSNPGHLLWTGLPRPERAEAVAQRLLEDDLFTGWGLRTLSSKHERYNPLSYQRGSVWPHDTALAAAGLRRYGRHDEASTLLRAVLEAACVFEDDRLPELFCGFDSAIGAPVPSSPSLSRRVSRRSWTRRPRCCGGGRREWNSRRPTGRRSREHRRRGAGVTATARCPVPRAAPVAGPAAARESDQGTAPDRECRGTEAAEACVCSWARRALYGPTRNPAAVRPPHADDPRRLDVLHLRRVRRHPRRHVRAVRGRHPLPVAPRAPR